MAGAAAQTRPGFAGLRFLSLIAALLPAPASAGAWIAPKGGQEIWTSVAGERDELSFFESAAYWEVPLGADNSVVAAPWIEQNYDSVDGWRGEAVLGWKHALGRSETGVLAVQGGALWMSHPPDGCGEGGAELRLLGGRAVGSSGFVNLEAGTRALDGGCGGERLELSAGYRPLQNWLAMGQVFLDGPREGEEAVRAQLTFIRFGASGRGIQVGVRSRLDGGADEAALVLGFWGRPGD